MSQNKFVLQFQESFQTSFIKRGLSFSCKLYKGFKILEKSLTMSIIVLSSSRKLQNTFTKFGSGSFSMVSIIVLSSSSPFLDTLCSKKIPFFTIKWHFFQFRTRFVSSHLYKTLTKLFKQ